MGKLVQPKVFLVGNTIVDQLGLSAYLEATGNEEFRDTYNVALEQGISSAEALCSMMAKLCYKSLRVGQNANISRVRGIKENLENCFDTGHGSILEHVMFNFVITDCSRVLTHELVRHRIGTAFSQTSGRYVVPIDEDGNGVLDFVMDPILEPVQQDIKNIIKLIETRYKRMSDQMGLKNMKNFGRKKKLTSALRRILPNGQSNEIGFSVNMRSIRHLVMMRTGRHSEWEIRLVFAQVYNLVKDKFPLVFYGAVEEEIDGIIEVSGMKMQPYEKSIADYSEAELLEELDRRGVPSGGQEG